MIESLNIVHDFSFSWARIKALVAMKFFPSSRACKWLLLFWALEISTCARSSALPLQANLWSVHNSIHSLQFVIKCINFTAMVHKSVMKFRLQLSLLVINTNLTSSFLFLSLMHLNLSGGCDAIFFWRKIDEPFLHRNIWRKVASYQDHKMCREKVHNED